MTDPQVSLRRVHPGGLADDARPEGAPPGGAPPEGAPPEDDSDPELAARIRAEIDERGPITVARFMQRALYEPGLGYYRRAVAGPGRTGDFLTAPEAHPIFGAAIGRLVEAVWARAGKPATFTLTELGAGTGALALGLLDGLRRAHSPLLAALRYRPTDIEHARVSAATERLSVAGFGGLLVTSPPAQGETGFVIANEVVDALPVHRVVVRDGRLCERLVTVEAGAFKEVDGEPSDPALALRLERADVHLENGQVVEICLALDRWVREGTAHLAQGVLVIVDYGEEATTLYRSARRDGTLRSFHRHQVVGDPFRRVGRQDITAHVDLTALGAAAAATGLTPLGRTTQAELLVGLGAGEIVADRLHAVDTDLQGALALRSALARLLDTRGMGGFAVVAFGRGMGDEPLPGFERVEIGQRTTRAPTGRS